MSIRIAGAAHIIPGRRVTNGELGMILDTSDDWIYPRTGIRSRCIRGDGDDMASLSASAAAAALRAAGIKAGGLDLIIASTLGGDYFTPSLSCLIQREIGAACPAFDLNAACSGFIYALDAANAYISYGRAKNVLIVCAEFMSKFTDWSDRSTAVLFGDGIGACVVTAGDSLKYIRLTATGSSEHLNIPSHDGICPYNNRRNDKSFVHQNGGEVFKYAVSVAAKECRLALDTLGLSYDDIGLFLLHQANLRIIDAIRERAKQSADKFPVNIDRYGNLSSATIPVLLSELLAEGRIKPGVRVCMLAFGAGFTSGTCIFEW